MSFPNKKEAFFLPTRKESIQREPSFPIRKKPCFPVENEPKEGGPVLKRRRESYILMRRKPWSKEALFPSKKGANNNRKQFPIRVGPVF
jgi:hypothetical protein